MSDKKTKHYASIYGALKPIRPDQYLCELIIQRRAEKKGIKLPDRFWSSKNIQYAYWSKIFFSECRHAKPLFQKYDPDCVIDAFQSFDCKFILSAANKQLEKIVQEFQRRKDLLESTKETNEVVIVETNILPRPTMGKPNKRSKLKND
jgi:hypothetical protein